MTSKQNKKLRNRKYDPFSRSFDIIKVLEEIKNNMSNVDNSKEYILTLLALPILNDESKRFYQNYNEIVGRIPMNKYDVVDHIFKLLNKNYFFKHINFRNRARKEIGDVFDSLKFTVESSEPGVGQVEVVSALEAEVDGAMNAINFVEGTDVSLNIDNQFEESDISKVIGYLIIQGIFMHILKDVYVDVTLNRGYFTYDQEREAILADYIDRDDLLIYKAGHSRMLNNMLMGVASSAELANTNFAKTRFKSNLGKRKIIKIRSIEGEIRIQYGLGQQIEAINKYLQNFSTIGIFYEFILIEGDKESGINLDDLIIAYSLLQEFTKDAWYIDEKEKGFENSDIPYKIGIEEVRNYYKSILNWSDVKISKALEILCPLSIKGRLDLWKAPITIINNTVYFSYMSLQNSLILYLADYWLERLGYDLDFRGPIFEKQLGHRIEGGLKSKRFTNKVFTSKHIYGGGNNEKEEVDLIVVMKSIIIVAEVKCIRYSINPRELSYSYKRLKEGSEQIEKKIKFINENILEVEKQLEISFSEKKIVPILVTNFQNMTGIKINNYPVVDGFLLESYFHSGKLGKAKIDSSGFSEVNDEDRYYYMNEFECNNNFSDFVNDPLPVKEILEKLEIRLNKKTSSNFSSMELYAYESEYK